MRALWIILPGFVVGVLLLESVRRIFTEDRTVVRELFRAQPVTLTAAATAVGSVLVWLALTVLGLM